MRLILFAAFLFVTSSFALWRGGAPERIVSLTFLVGAIVTAVISASLASAFGAFEAGLFLVDLAMLVVIVAVALNAERFWPLWLSAFQMFQVISHLPPLIMAELLPQTYLVIVSFWAYPMLLILFAGTVRHRLRLAEYGTDKSWSSS